AERQKWQRAQKPGAEIDFKAVRQVRQQRLARNDLEHSSGHRDQVLRMSSADLDQEYGLLGRDFADSKPANEDDGEFSALLSSFRVPLTFLLSPLILPITGVTDTSSHPETSTGNSSSTGEEGVAPPVVSEAELDADRSAF